MGTDIHLVVEIKRQYDPDWTLADSWEPTDKTFIARELHIWRDYSVFRKLVSGVRELDHDNVVACISDPRGIPEDAHDKTRAWLLETDYHSVSWITTEEFMKAFPWQGSWKEMSHFALVCYSYLYEMEHNNVRVRFIFGFDS